MPSVSVTSLKGNKLLSWLICFGVAALATFLLYDPARPQVNMYWFGTILAIAMFATSLLPNFATVVLLLMYYIITGVASPEMAFVGWTAPIPWLSMCGMLLGVLMDKCNLANRIALVLLTRIGTTPVRLYAAFLLAGLVLAELLLGPAAQLPGGQGVVEEADIVAPADGRVVLPAGERAVVRGRDAVFDGVGHIGGVPGAAVREGDCAVVVELVHAGGDLDGLGEGEALVGAVGRLCDAVYKAELHSGVDVAAVPAVGGHVAEAERGGAGVASAYEQGGRGRSRDRGAAALANDVELV